MSESKHQSALFQYLRQHEARHPDLSVVHASMNGASASSKAAAALRQRQGQLKGVYDVFVPVPRSGYHGLWVELKFGRNKLTPEQKVFGERMESYGYRCAVHYDWQDAAREIFEYLGI